MSVLGGFCGYSVEVWLFVLVYLVGWVWVVVCACLGVVLFICTNSGARLFV